MAPGWSAWNDMTTWTLDMAMLECLWLHGRNSKLVGRNRPNWPQNHPKCEKSAANTQNAKKFQNILWTSLPMSSPFPKVLTLFSPFLGLFEKARFFRPKQGFLVNIVLFEFFTVVVDLPCMSTVWTIAYIGRPLHAHVPDYHSSGSIVSLVCLPWWCHEYSGNSYCERSTFCLFQARKEHFISIFQWTQSLSLIVLWQFLLRKEPFLLVSGPKRALYEHFWRDAKGTKGELKKHLWERASHEPLLLVLRGDYGQCCACDYGQCCACDYGQCCACDYGQCCACDYGQCCACDYGQCCACDSTQS